jgi:hypothetical protein
MKARVQSKHHGQSAEHQATCCIIGSGHCQLTQKREERWKNL